MGHTSWACENAGMTSLCDQVPARGREAQPCPQDLASPVPSPSELPPQASPLLLGKAEMWGARKLVEERPETASLPTGQGPTTPGSGSHPP